MSGPVAWKPAGGALAYGVASGELFITAMLVLGIFPFQVYMTAGWSQSSCPPPPASSKELDSIAQQINQSNLETMLDVLNDFKPYETSNLYLVSRRGYVCRCNQGPRTIQDEELRFP